MEDQDIAAVPPPEEEPKVDSVEEDMKTEEPAPPAPAPSEESNKPTDIDIPKVEPKIEDNNTNTEEDAATAAINSDIKMGDTGESAAAPSSATAAITKMVENTTEESAAYPSAESETTAGDNTMIATTAATEEEKESINNPGVSVEEDVPTSPPACDMPVKEAVHPEPPQASPVVKADIPSVDGNTIKNNNPLPDGASATAVLSPGRIPKKVLAPPNSLGSTLPLVNRLAGSNSFDNALVLPDGVVLPPTVTPQMLEGRLRRAFFELNPTQMKECLSEYNDAVKEKGAEIRNHAAYLFGVVKRYKTIHERSFTDPNALPQGKELTDQVKVSTLYS